MTDFDPFIYHADVKANPESYVLVSDIIAEVTALRAIRNANNMAVLKSIFQTHAKLAKGNTELLALITEAKDSRKIELGVK